MSRVAETILAGLLERRTGQVLAGSRAWRIETELRPLMRERGIGTLDQLVANLVDGTDPALAGAVVDALLNNETSFFRDRTAFEMLLGGGIDRIATARAANRTLRIWCAGCSTGQEAYSIAIALAEDPVRWRGWSIDIVGTDVSRSAIARAEQGRFPQMEIQRGLPMRQMVRWFEKTRDGEWQVADAIRSKVRFVVRGLGEPPPAPGTFDVILCRNVLLYFAPDVRRAAFDRLAEASAADTLLMLGAGETVIGQTCAFRPHPDCRGFYARVSDAELGEKLRA